MDIETTLIGIVLVIVCATPFIVLTAGRKKAEKKKQKAFFDLAQRHGCQIDHFDMGNHSVIGIDTAQNTVLFYKQTSEGTQEHCVPLKDIQSCKRRVVNNTRKVTERLQLVLTPLPKLREKGTPEISLEFYNAEVEMQLEGELQLLEKWETLINSKLKA